MASTNAEQVLEHGLGSWPIWSLATSLPKVTKVRWCTKLRGVGVSSTASACLTACGHTVHSKVVLDGLERSKPVYTIFSILPSHVTVCPDT